MYINALFLETESLKPEEKKKLQELKLKACGKWESEVGEGWKRGLGISS